MLFRGFSLQRSSRKTAASLRTAAGGLLGCFAPPNALFALLLAVACAVPAFPAGEGQLDGSPAIFSVLAAINAAGYDQDINSPANHPLRAQVRKYLASRKIDSLLEIKRFVRDHKLADPNQELSKYISFALSTDGPPYFKYKFRSNEVPPDVAPLEGFNELMVRFHEEANIDDVWKQVQPAYDQIIERYHEPVSRAILEVNGYLRNVTSGYLGRRFQIYVDVLGAPNQIHTRNYAENSYIVLTPSPEPQIDDIRHAYLHYLIDPLTVKYGEHLAKKRGLIDYAQGSPVLGDAYKEDFYLLAGECLIKAIEARLAPASKRQGMVDAALKEGFVVTPFFFEHLPVYEKQEQNMRYYFPDMITAIDLKKEERRLENIEFATTRAVRKAKPTKAPEPPPLSAAEKLLEQAESLYKQRDLPKARQTWLDALSKTDEKTLHAKAYYGLARVATLEKDPELAQRLFRKTLELGPEPFEKGWTLVYLGQLSDLAGEHSQALAYFKEAIGLEGISDLARKSAEKGLQREGPKKEN